jgi:hypothetical protein
MGVRRILGSGAALVALALIGAPAAFAAQRLTPTGELTYTWHGDPARGCARVGVCGVQGVLIVRPQGPINVFQASSRTAQLEFNTVGATVRVRRTDPGTEGNCIEPQNGFDGSVTGLTLSWTRSGAVTGALQGPPSSGRCAGPLASEFARIPLRGRRHGGSRSSFDLRQSEAFTAGPYSGSLVSTLRLRAQSGPGNPVFSSARDAATTASPGPFTRLEQLQLVYRVSVPPTTLSIPFRGALDPACEPFDACGVHGIVSLALKATRQTLVLTATRRAPRHVNRREALRAFAAGAFDTIAPASGPGPNIHVELSEVLARPGAPTCTDTRAERLQVIWEPPLPYPKAAIPVELSTLGLDGFSVDDPLRTHCPGPESDDVLGLSGLLGSSSVRPRALLAHRSTVTLATHGRFAASGYAGSWGDAVRIVLTLVKVRVSTAQGIGGPARDAAR